MSFQYVSIYKIQYSDFDLFPFNEITNWNTEGSAKWVECFNFFFLHIFHADPPPQPRVPGELTLLFVCQFTRREKEMMCHLRPSFLQCLSIPFFVLLPSLSVCLSLALCLSVSCLSVSLSLVYLSICLSVSASVSLCACMYALTRSCVGV